MTLDEQAILRLNDLLREAGRRIVIVSHTNPDGDAVGSSLAWAEILRGMGHRVLCVVPNKYPYFLDWMTGIEEVVVYKTDTEGRAARAVEEADLIFCLDFNAISRLENLSDVIESNTTARRVLIDHHLAPDPGFELMFSHPDASSTSFIVYKIIERLCGTGAITPAMAEAMYVGMMTDTGNFSFSFLTPDLYRAVAVLAETGIDLPQIHIKIKELPRKTKEVTLFNGTDLKGWEAYGTEKWYVEDGLLICESGPDKKYGYLATRDYYDDFDLTVEFKQEADGNSGVFIRSFIEEDVKVNGWQVEVAPKGHDTGGIYESYGRGWLIQIPDEKENILKEGDWNTMRIKVQGDNVQTWLNGQEMVNINDEKIGAGQGRIALQIHDGGGIKVLWRNLKVKTL